MKKIILSCLVLGLVGSVYAGIFNKNDKVEYSSITNYATYLLVKDSSPTNIVFEKTNIPERVVKKMKFKLDGTNSVSLIIGERISFTNDLGFPLIRSDERIFNDFIDIVTE